MASTDVLMMRMVRARRAYEWGGIFAATRVAWFVVPMTLLALPTCGQPVASIVTGATLLVLCMGLVWRGQEYGASVYPGLIGGVVPLVLPLLFRAGRHPCVGEFCWTTSVPLSICGGLVAGSVVAVRAARMVVSRGAFLLSGLAVAGCAGSLGCVYGGVAGLLGLVVGVVAGSLPVFAVSRMVYR